MTATVSRETWAGPLKAVFPDGRVMVHRQDVIRTDDWREFVVVDDDGVEIDRWTSNCGHVQMLAARLEYE